MWAVKINNTNRDEYNSIDYILRLYNTKEEAENGLNTLLELRDDVKERYNPVVEEITRDEEFGDKIQIADLADMGWKVEGKVILPHIEKNAHEEQYKYYRQYYGGVTFHKEDYPYLLKYNVNATIGISKKDRPLAYYNCGWLTRSNFNERLEKGIEELEKYLKETYGDRID